MPERARSGLPVTASHIRVAWDLDRTRLRPARVRLDRGLQHVGNNE
jgi:hypothetical protein